MDEEDFKDRMKDIFDEAKEEFMGRPVHLPHMTLKIECPYCEDSYLNKNKHSEKYFCVQCESVFDLQLICVEKKHN